MSTPIPRTRRAPVRNHRAPISIRRGGRTYRYSISQRMFENLIEDLDALSSPKYLASIRRARRDVAAGRVYTLEEIKCRYGIR